MTHRRNRGARVGAMRSRGQALVETLVACLLLLPLWWAVYYVSRWHDVQFTTINAARYAAFASWTAAGRDAPGYTAAIARERLFSRDPARFTADGAAAAADSLGAVEQWRD
jgi:hypothetical protein